MRLVLAVYVTALALMIALAAAGAVVLYRDAGPDDAAEAAAGAHGYDLVSWETKHFPEKWLSKQPHLVDGQGGQAADETVCTCFQLAREVRDAAGSAGDDSRKRL